MCRGKEEGPKLGPKVFLPFACGGGGGGDGLQRPNGEMRRRRPLASSLMVGWLAGWLAARCDEREEDDGGKEGKTASYMGVIVVEEGFFI